MSCQIKLLFTKTEIILVNILIQCITVLTQVNMYRFVNITHYNKIDCSIRNGRLYHIQLGGMLHININENIFVAMT